MTATAEARTIHHLESPTSVTRIASIAEITLHEHIALDAESGISIVVPRRRKKEESGNTCVAFEWSEEGINRQVGVSMDHENAAGIVSRVEVYSFGSQDVLGKDGRGMRRYATRIIGAYQYEALTAKQIGNATIRAYEAARSLAI